jgi:hypothetical protein
VIVLRWQGNVFEAKNLEHLPDPPPATVKRGVVDGFSKRSRSRMIDFLMRLDLSGVKCSFVTLTFAKPPSITEAKKAYKRFAMRLRRHFPQLSAIWRLEFQERGAAHFHMIWINAPFVRQATLQRVWEACTGELMSIVDVRRVRSHKQLINYVSKYIAKVSAFVRSTSLDNEPYQHVPQKEKTGRIWGYINKEGMPLAQAFDLILTDEQVGGYVWFAIRAMSRGRSGNYDYCAKAYTPEAEDMYIHAMKLGATTDNNYIWRNKSKAGAEQWFGGTAVPSSTSVSIGVSERETIVTQDTLWTASENPFSEHISKFGF